MKTSRNKADSQGISKDLPEKHRASTMEGRENELIAMAYDAVEDRIRSGTATSQELVHFLRLGSMKERMELETMKADVELKQAKVKAIQDGEHLEEVYNNAIEAMKRYSGSDSE